MSFGYPTQYANGLNSNSQLRRSMDMIYQRGGEYEVILTGDTYTPTMELDVQLFADDKQVGKMNIVPYKVQQTGSTFTYKFHIRPYDYLSNYIKSEHYQYYWLDNWYETNQQINIKNPYPNSIKANIKYRYQYITGTTYTGETSYNDYNHYTSIPICSIATGYTASEFVSTGSDFDFFGGSFQMGRDKYFLPNFDQELGSVVDGTTVYTLDVNRRQSPMSQYMFDFPTVPEMSETSRFLTNAPRIQKIQDDENFELSFLNGLSGDRQLSEVDFIVFTVYDLNGNFITTFYEQINFAGTPYATPTTGYTDTLRIFQVPCGPVDITNIFNNVDWSEVGYYTVQMFYGYPTDSDQRISKGPIGPTSEAFYFYLTTNCKPENTRLCFLNAAGGFDYFTFTSYRQESKKITRQTYDNRYYSTSVQSPDRNVGRTVKTFDTNVDNEFVIESDWLSVPYGNWLEELFLSPQVYEVKDDFISPIDKQDKIYKDLKPIQVLSTEVETITKKHQKLNKYRITYKSADGYFVSKGF